MIEYSAEFNSNYSYSYLLNYGRDVKMPTLSPAIHAWATRNKVFLFDFDNWYFRSDIPVEFLKKYLDEIVKTHNYLLVCEQHPFNTKDDRYQLRHQQIVDLAMPKLKTMVATSDWAYWNKDKITNYTFLPMWYFEQRHFSKTYHYDKFNFPIDRKYLFSCVNKANLRSEKIYNYIKCYQRRSTDWFLTAYQVPDLPNTIPACTSEQNLLWQTEILPGLAEFAHDLENFAGANTTSAKDETTTAAFSMLFPGYTQSHVNLAIEHSMEFPVASEKTFKPFASNQIPIFLGTTGIANCMRMLGFDIFDDIVDHTAYDNVNTARDHAGQVETWSSRVDAVHQLIDNLTIRNFKDCVVQPDILARRNKNKIYFYTTEIDKICVRWLAHTLTTVKANNIFTDIR